MSSIDWSQLLDIDAMDTLVNVSTAPPVCPKCHTACGTRPCWGPENDQCQIRKSVYPQHATTPAQCTNRDARRNAAIDNVTRRTRRRRAVMLRVRAGVQVGLHFALHNYHDQAPLCAIALAAMTTSTTACASTSVPNECLTIRRHKRTTSIRPESIRIVYSVSRSVRVSRFSPVACTTTVYRL
jgi:hypothetical protein